VTTIAPLTMFTAARAGSGTKEMLAGCNFYSSIDDDSGSCIILGGSTVPKGAFCSAYQAKKTV